MKGRYSRQEGIVPMDKLQDIKATVIGVGSIGRSTALGLASLGIQNLQLVDFDTVEEPNIASQGYHEQDIGIVKVDATARLCREINSTIDVTPVNGRFTKGLDVGNVAFVCVDSIKTREFIWNAIKDRVALYVDGRMAVETLRILAIDRTDIISKEYYPKTLFKEEEAYVGACTTKATIYCSMIAAGFLVSTFAKWLRGTPIDKDIMINLFAYEINNYEE